jgi:hypothetical protein
MRFSDYVLIICLICFLSFIAGYFQGTISITAKEVAK